MSKNVISPRIFLKNISLQLRDESLVDKSSGWAWSALDRRRTTRRGIVSIPRRLGGNRFDQLRFLWGFLQDSGGDAGYFAMF